MGIWFILAAWLGSMILGRVLNPIRLPQNQDAAPEKFGGITAVEGRTIPVLWGTRQFKGPNILWIGDFSTTPIVQSGVTTGYKYYMGAQYGICMGPIDEVLAVTFNEKPVGAGFTSANNAFIFAKSGAAPWKTARIAESTYSNGFEVAAALEAAIITAEPGDWRVGYGFSIVAGVNNIIKYRLTGTTSHDGTIVTVTLTPGEYTGSTLASHIETKMNQAEAAIRPGGLTAASFDVSYGVFGAFKFAITYSAAAEWATTFALLPSTGKFMLGFRHDLDDTANHAGSTITGGYEVKIGRFIISYGGNTAALHLTDAGFTSAAILGLSTAADRTALGIVAADSDFTIIEAVFTPSSYVVDVAIDDADFFGTEGGVSGSLDIYLGTVDQLESSYLTTQFGTTAPGYHRLCYAIQRGMYVGNTNYPKPISFTLRRCPNQLGLADEQHNIAGDANPACMLYEALTDVDWGLGIPPASILVDSFITMGEALYGEGLGLSMILDTTSEASDTVREILRHVDGVLYLDGLTGLIAVRLARADYFVADLPLVSPANAHDCEIRQRSWEETRNVVRIRYVDRAQNFTERVFQAQDLANIAARGGEQSVEDIPMPGISSEANAQIVATRALKVLSDLPRLITLRVNRECWNLRPGSPFRLTWPAWGVTDLPCRVSTIGMGEIQDGVIRVNAVQDVIGPPWTGFVAPTAPADDPPE